MSEVTDVGIRNVAHGVRHAHSQLPAHGSMHRDCTRATQTPVMIERKSRKDGLDVIVARIVKSLIGEIHGFIKKLACDFVGHCLPLIIFYRAIVAGFSCAAAVDGTTLSLAQE